MAADAVFIDTWALLALTNRDDARHIEAVDLTQQFLADRRPLITSEWILTEFLGGAARPPLRSLAVESVRLALASSRMEVIRKSRQLARGVRALCGSRRQMLVARRLSFDPHLPNKEHRRRLHRRSSF